jgi:predicted MPP superfamily phosphohydrolase
MEDLAAMLLQKMVFVWVRYAVFLTVLTLILWMTNRFVHRRAVASLALRARWAKGLGLLLAVSIVSVIGARIVDRFIPDVALLRAVAQVGMIVQLAVMITAVLMIPVALLDKFGDWRRARAVKSSAAAAMPAETVAPSADSPPRSDDLSPQLLPRRGLLSRGASGAALAVGGGSALYGSLFGRHDYQIEVVPVRLPRLPRELDGFTIAQLSDIHLGTFVGDEQMRAGLALTADTSPDIIVLTGDLIDHDARYADQLGRWVRRLGAIAPVAVIPGNHDYYSGIEATLAAVRGAGAAVLVNDAIHLRDGKMGRAPRPRPGDKTPGLTLFGVDDVWGDSYGGPGPDLARALGRADPDAARVLLCHNPSTFEENAPHVGLQLSGHTHGGQVNLGLRPADLLLPHRFVEGHYREGESQLYVNRGFGTAGPPARVGAPPEVTKVVLTV